jgi:predicted HTH transcriptional regulator
MSDKLPQLLEIDPYKEVPTISTKTIKELLNYANEVSNEKESLLDFADTLWNSKCALTAAIRMTDNPSLNKMTLLGVFETVEVIISEKLVLYKQTETEEMPYAKEIIGCLYHNEGLRDEQIAEKLNVDVDKLTDTLSKLVINYMITYSRPGKYMYYYLAGDGCRFYEDRVLPF